MAGILENLENMAPVSEATLEGNALLEGEIVLAAIQESCANEQEFSDLLNAVAVEMALYDVIPDASVAMEVAKKIVITDYKAAQFNRITKRTAIRLAKVNGDPMYGKYKTYRDKFLAIREQIYKKYEAKAKQEAKRILKNAARKAGNMPSPEGKTVVDKIDRQISKATGK
ncbi:MAG: hypothetical protein NC548_05645 [Lachnospiraceae bacterium]|nr:hypothetical protein [Lachnospiraceae bacterium]